MVALRGPLMAVALLAVTGAVSGCGSSGVGEYIWQM
jgi:hypothetical protein